ncbi:hypothetical protein T4D_16136 [Trichinella pseudospiralis]|uniref:Uncharacterized protein n=1 Tax=Trichinella pseudospiralis TaxID=6337 RepID=A0A0V1FUJ5_TRIPS|nr:hypothetical protein T4D_16136 [Trichinella pseudospiralis]
MRRDTLRRVLTKSVFCYGDFSQIVYILTEFSIDHLCRQGVKNEEYKNDADDSKQIADGRKQNKNRKKS